MRHLLIAILLTSTALAQAPPIDESVEVHLLALEVRATDRDGRHAPGLTAADFDVRLDRDPVEIAYLDEVRATASPVDPLAPPTSPTASNPRYTVLFVDRVSLGLPDQPRGLDALRNFVLRLSPDDQAMLVAHDGELQVVQPYTSSREQLLGGLGDLAEKSPLGAMRRAAERSTLEAISRGRRASQREALASNYAREAALDARRTIDSLQRAVDDLAGQPGRRSLVVLSTGFEARPGETALAVAGGRTFSPATADISNRMLDLVRHANANGVAIYALDPTGLGTDGFPEVSLNFLLPVGVSAASIRHLRQDPLRSLAADTGGVAAVDSNDLDGALGRLYEAISNYYVLSVRLPKGAKVDEYRRVDVRSRAEGVRIVARSGIAGLAPEQRRALETEAALVAGRRLGDLPVALDVMLQKKGGLIRKPVIAAKVAVPAKELTWTTVGSERSARATVSFLVIDDRGRRSRLATQFWEPRRAASDESPVLLTVPLEVRDGNQRILVAVRDDVAGRAGSAEYAIHID